MAKIKKETYSVHTGYGHRAKKSMGQNFLKSEPALRMMCEAGDVNKKDIILEIGPGKGALTEKLLEKAGKVIAVEKDRDLYDLLKEKFAEEIKTGSLILILGDVLDFDPANHNIKKSEYKIIANIPYNITGAIIKKFLSLTIQPSTMILLVQKEVAERIVATDKKESILSLSVKAYGTPKYMMKVEKRFFSPSPKVDSAIVSITNIESVHTRYGLGSEDEFFKVIKAGFAHKRKVLRKNLESVASTNTIGAMFTELSIASNTRAEDLPLPIWLDIVRYLSKKI